MNTVIIFLVRVRLDLEPIRGTLDMRQEYSLDEKPVNKYVIQIKKLIYSIEIKIQMHCYINSWDKLRPNSKLLFKLD